jgi:hypothetical protein
MNTLSTQTLIYILTISLGVEIIAPAAAVEDQLEYDLAAVEDHLAPGIGLNELTKQQ